MEALLALLKELGAKPEAIEAAKAEYEESVEGLKNKNTELLIKLKKAKDESSNSGNNTALLDLEEKVSNLTAENSALKKKMDIAENKRQSAEKELNEQLNSERSALNKVLIDDGLIVELSKLGITSSVKIAAARALLKEKGIFQIKTDGEARKAIATLKKDGKDVELSLSDYLTKEWAVGDEGKDFIPNGGSGSGSTGGAGGKAKTTTLDEAYQEAAKNNDVASMMSIKARMAKEKN